MVNIRTICLATLFAYALSVLLLTLSEAKRNYEGRSGLVLANGRSIGADFLTFYVAGELYRSDRKQLYNFTEQISRQEKLMDGNTAAIGGRLPFVYPPLVAASFSLFSRTNYLHAYFYWTGLSLLLFITSLLLLSAEERSTAFALALALVIGLGFQPFLMECLLGGQTSAIGLFLFTLIYIALKRDRQICAGFFLSLGYYKPPLFLGLALALLLLRKWQAIVSASLCMCALLAVSAYIVGIDGLVNYFTQASSYTYGSEVGNLGQLPTDRGMGLYGLTVSLLGGPNAYAKTVYVVCSLTLVAISVFILRSRTIQPKLDYSALVITSLFVSPQMINYDLSILLLPLFLMRHYFAKDWLFTLSVFGLYLEWLMRRVELTSVSFNTSALLFMLLLAALLRQIIQDSKSI